MELATNPDLVGYWIAGGLNVALALCLISIWRSRTANSLLLPAVVISALWAFANAAVPRDRSALSLVAELARSLVWIELLAKALNDREPGRARRILRAVPWVIASATVLFGLYELRSIDLADSRAAISQCVIVAQLAMGLIGVVLVEQALRNTRDAHVWELKLIWIVVAAQFGYEVALYSASYALGGLQETLYAARGFAAAALVPLLAVGVSRLGGYKPQVFMSQRLAFYTTSVFISGAYLICVSIGAYYVRAYGGRWADTLEILLIFLALVLLAGLLLSRALRARVRVFLAKHWLPYKYDFRNEWLDLTARLTGDENETSLAQRTIDAFVRLAHVRSGVILTKKDEVLVATAGESHAEFSMVAERADSPFCLHLSEREWILDLDRARAKIGRDADVPVPEWLMAANEVWLAIPLIHQKRLCAIVLLRRPFVGTSLTWEDLDLLRTAARQAASYVALEASADDLARERQFAALNRLTAFLMHDLSNIVAQQQLIVTNSSRHRNNPEFFDDAIQTIDNTVHRLGRVLEQLKSGSVDAPQPRKVYLGEVCRAVVSRLSDRQPVPVITEVDERIAVVVSRDRFEHVLEHLIRNAQDATPPDGSIQVRVFSNSTQALVEIADTGVGMTAEFIRARLYRPFDTTKGAKGMGIGAFQAREFLRASGGDLGVTSVPARGTSFVIRLPLFS